MGVETKKVSAKQIEAYLRTGDATAIEDVAPAFFERLPASVTSEVEIALLPIDPNSRFAYLLGKSDGDLLSDPRVKDAIKSIRYQIGENEVAIIEDPEYPEQDRFFVVYNSQYSPSRTDIKNKKDPEIESTCDPIVIFVRADAGSIKLRRWQRRELDSRHKPPVKAQEHNGLNHSPQTTNSDRPTRGTVFHQNRGDIRPTPTSTSNGRR